MKYVFLVPDGMADYPLKELNGKTPLMAARVPFMDKIAQAGIVGRAKTIPDGLNPGSDVANLSLLGYDPLKYYSGRAPLEAANIGITLARDEVAFRCNFITEENGLVADYSAGHISNSEAKDLVDYLNRTIGSKEIKFYSGVSYRNLLVIKTRDKEKLLRLECFPPHDITGKSTKEHMPEGPGAEEVLCPLILKSKEVLSKKNSKANLIWPWGQGVTKAMPSFFELHRKKASIISAVDLVKGIGRVLSMKVVEVPGATGYLDTNYLGKAEYALEELNQADLVYIHVEATDEASHEGRLKDKIEALERIDKIMVSLFWDALQKRKIDRILIAADHYTPITLRTHTPDPVPFAMAGQGIKQGKIRPLSLSEEEALKSDIFFEEGYNLMARLLSHPQK